jgi:hypothetical protein
MEDVVEGEEEQLCEAGVKEEESKKCGGMAWEGGEGDPTAMEHDLGSNVRIMCYTILLYVKGSH